MIRQFNNLDVYSKATNIHMINYIIYLFTLNNGYIHGKE